MAVECPGTALCARRAPEPYLLNNGSETFHGRVKKAVAFLGQRCDAQRNRSQGNKAHLTDLPETVAAHLIAFVTVSLACGSSQHLVSLQLVSEPFFLKNLSISTAF
jgi:hypothetical protein